MSRFFVVCTLICLVFQANFAFAMTSTNFGINWDNINEGGDDSSSSTNFSIHDTLGDLATGTSTSANFNLSAGYRAGDAQTATTSLTFVIRALDNGFIPVAYSAFSSGSKTVTASVTSTFAVDDYIAVVENKGYAEFVAIGKITDITGSVITVDSFDGDQLSMSAVPSGGNDFIYRLPSTVLNFGDVTQAAQNVSVAMSSVFSTVSSGYTVYVNANRLFQNALGQVMTAVTDGAVSTGAEEYGAEVTGATAFSPGSDLGVTTTLRAIQSSGSPSVTYPDRVAMIYKISINGGTQPGAYTHTVFYTLTANY